MHELDAYIAYIKASIGMVKHRAGAFSGFQR